MSTSIPAPSDEDTPFPIEDTLTVYEAAMVYAGRHPYPRMFGPYDDSNKIERCRTLLKVGLPASQHAQLSWDIFLELEKRIEQGTIEPHNPIHDRAERIDPFRTEISITDLARLAKDRGEKPEYLDGIRPAAPKHPPSLAATDRFATQYIEDEIKSGRGPTMLGLEKAAKAANFGAGRETLRKVFREMRGSLKRGRPIK
jgi:hypothetical protein